MTSPNRLAFKNSVGALLQTLRGFSAQPVTQAAVVLPESISAPTSAMPSIEEPFAEPFCAGALGALKQYAGSESTESICDESESVDGVVLDTVKDLLESVEVMEQSQSAVALFFDATDSMEESWLAGEDSAVPDEAATSYTAITIDQLSEDGDEQTDSETGVVERVTISPSPSSVSQPTIVDMLLAHNTFQLLDDSSMSNSAALFPSLPSVTVVIGPERYLGGTNVDGWPTSAYGPSVPPQIMRELPPVVSSSRITPSSYDYPSMPVCYVPLKRIPDDPNELAEFTRQELQASQVPMPPIDSHPVSSDRHVHFEGGEAGIDYSASTQTVEQALVGSSVSFDRQPHFEKGAGGQGASTSQKKTTSTAARKKKPRPIESTVPVQDQLPQTSRPLVSSNRAPKGNVSPKKRPRTADTPAGNSETPRPAKKSKLSAMEVGENACVEEKRASRACDSSAKRSQVKQPPLRRRVVVEEDGECEEESDVASLDDSTEASPSPPPVSRPSKQRPKNATGRGRTEKILANSKAIFAQAPFPASCNPANQVGRARIYVPPVAAADLTRKRMSTAALRSLISAFCSAGSSTQILFAELQHEERIQVVRKLLPLAFLDTFDVEPLLRLLQQNCTRLTDPLTGLLSGLTAELIDTRQATHTSSAHAMLFLYALPLFLQRWGIMSFATTAVEQWSAIGLHYYNWSQVNRWPELLIVAPEETAALIKEVLADETCTLSEGFQTRLGELFAERTDLVARWWFTRRRAFRVRGDTTGHSLEINLLVTQTANWLQTLSQNVRKGVLIAEDWPLSTPLIYPAPSVYRAVVPALTALIVNANPAAVQLQLINRSVLATYCAADEHEWLSFSGGNQMMKDSFTALQACTPTQTAITIGTHGLLPELVVHSLWAAPDDELAGSFSFRLPIVALRDLQGQLEAATAAAVPSSSTQTEEAQSFAFHTAPAKKYSRSRRYSF